MQGLNEVKWRSGQEASLAPAYSNLSSFTSTFTVLQKVFVTLLGFSAPPTVIRHPQSDLVPGELCPLRYAPAHMLCLVFAFRYLMLL